MVSRSRYVFEGASIIAGLATLSAGAYVSYDLPITGTWIALVGSAGALAGAVSRSWRMNAQDRLEDEIAHGHQLEDQVIEYPRGYTGSHL